LQPLAAAAVHGCRELLDRWCDYSAELRAFGDNLLRWRSLEPSDSVESSILGAVTSRLAGVSAAEEGLGAALQTALLEPLEFLHADCLHAARDCVDDTLRRHPPASFVPAQPYLHTEAAAHNGWGAAAGGLAELRRVQEAVAAAGETVCGWDACRRTRGAMTVQQLLRAACELADQVDIGLAHQDVLSLYRYMLALDAAFGGARNVGRSAERAAADQRDHPRRGQRCTRQT
jgi:hypothetical protein